MARRKKSYNRRRRRSRRRNTWFGDRAGHRRAALKGWRGRRRRKGGRKRRSSKRKYRSRRGRGRVRRKGGRRRGRRSRVRRRNIGGGTGALNSLTSSLTAGMDVRTLGNAGVIAGGAAANAAVSTLVSSLIPLDFLKKGPGNYIVGLGTAGLTGFAVGKVKRDWAAPIFLGGVIQVVTRAINEFILPMLPGMKGLGDYLTVADARDARALGDYLTVSDARNARALGYMAQQDTGGDRYIAEELAELA